jgi:hypothetical protein
VQWIACIFELFFSSKPQKPMNDTTNLADDLGFLAALDEHYRNYVSLMSDAHTESCLGVLLNRDLVDTRRVLALMSLLPATTIGKVLSTHHESRIRLGSGMLALQWNLSGALQGEFMGDMLYVHGKPLR